MGGRAGSSAREGRRGEKDCVSFRLVLVRRADEEYDHAIDWYLAEAPHEVERFIATFEATVEAIRERPLLPRVSYRELRSVRTAVFPYHLWYRVLEDIEVEPSLDGSLVSVVLDETVADRSRAEAGDLSFEVPSEFANVKVEVSLGAPVAAATRNHAANPSTYSGAIMHRLGTNGVCTTGYRMTQISGSVPVMGSAHHCYRGVENEAWGYTTITGYPTGNATSIYGAGMSNGDVAVWKGPIADHMLAAVFVGDHTVAGSNLYAVNGAMSNPVGSSVCYSGSRSGTMCSNTVIATDVTSCYGGGLPCYNNLVRTSQAANMPAAGNGDSGGPVYTTQSGIYASGVISGIALGRPETMPWRSDHRHPEVQFRCAVRPSVGTDG